MSDRLKIFPFRHPVYGEDDGWADVVCRDLTAAYEAAEEFASLPGPHKGFAPDRSSDIVLAVEQRLRELGVSYQLFLQQGMLS